MSWIWAFIRKESAFDARAVSRAHAVGLMQLLPRTAAALVDLPGFDAAHVRQADGAPDLFDPATNIELGAAYLAALSARFGGQLPLVAAAYNAGPGAVAGWLAPSGTVRLDQFVETIPYRETREYVKRLVEGWVRVERLHLGHSLQESLRGVPVRLDVSVRPGVDF